MKSFALPAASFFVALLLSAVSTAPVSGADDARPNVIYVFTDQQHAGMLSCAGNPYVKTPAMDSLAQTGVRFERAYSANPVCVPSRVAMLTGHLPSRFGMQSNTEIGTTKIPEPVLQQALGSLFRSAGYLLRWETLPANRDRPRPEPH
jgi:choline-sulfatase